jgi:hypothetical protein
LCREHAAVPAASDVRARADAAPDQATDDGDGDDRPDAADHASAGNGAAGERVPGEVAQVAPAPSGWWRDPFVVVAAALVLVPVVAAALSALRHPFVPTNDWALIELQVRKVGTGDTPLLGAWSRFGWRHPGPWPFYLMALPYRLVPSDKGLLFSAACVNLLAAVGYVLVVARYRRTRALLALLGLAVVEWGLGADQLADPWNPTILLVPFAVYVVLGLEIAVGRARWPIPVAVGVASFVIQAHVGLVQPVLLLAAAAAGLRWCRARSDAAAALEDAAVSEEDLDRPADGEDEGAPATTSEPTLWRRLATRTPWRTVGVTGAVLTVAWLPAVLDQIAGDGNLGMLFRWSLGDKVAPGMGQLTEGRLPADRVLNGGAWLLDPIGLWVGRFQPLVVFGSPLLGVGKPLTLLWLPAVLGAALALVRWAPMDRSDRRTVVTLVVLAVTGVVAVFTDLTSARGAAVFWPFRWAVLVVLLVVLALAWALAAVASHRFPWLDAPLRPARPAGAGVRARPRPAVLGVGALLVAAVALPVGLTVGRGSLGEQPKQAASNELLHLRSRLLRRAGHDAPVASNTKILINPNDLAVPVLLSRAGIDWVERDDPRADGRPNYVVVTASEINTPVMAASIMLGDTEIVARSGPPYPDGKPDEELILIRATVKM